MHRLENLFKVLLQQFLQVNEFELYRTIYLFPERNDPLHAFRQF